MKRAFQSMSWVCEIFRVASELLKRPRSSKQNNSEFGTTVDVCDPQTNGCINGRSVVFPPAQHETHNIPFIYIYIYISLKLFSAGSKVPFLLCRMIVLQHTLEGKTSPTNCKHQHQCCSMYNVDCRGRASLWEAGWARKLDTSDGMLSDSEASLKLFSAGSKVPFLLCRMIVLQHTLEGKTSPTNCKHQHQ